MTRSNAMLAVLCLALLAALGVSGRCAQSRGERLGRADAAAAAATARADSTALAFATLAAAADTLRATRRADSIALAATRAASRRTAETLSATATAAERAAADSAVTADSLRVVIVTLVADARADSAAHAADQRAADARIATLERVVVADSVAIRAGRQALIDANLASAKREAALRARIPSGWRTLAEKVGWGLVGYGAGRIAP